MNLNPIPYFASKALQFGLKFSNTGGRIAAATRAHDDMLGAWAGPIGGFIPHQVNPFLYEALREAVGLLDGSIRTLVTLDGIVTVEGDNDRLVGEIEDFIESVPVNDADKGLNAFYVLQGNETYEQGCSIGEWVPTRDGRDLAGLHVADSKGLAFRRGERGLECWYRPAAPRARPVDSGSQTVEMLLRNRGSASALSWLSANEYTQLDAARLVYVANDHEADNPYGTSKLRSLEFVGQLLVKIENATARVWERYGDPPFHVKYSTKNPASKSEAWLTAKRNELQVALADALRSKSVGNSADLVTALGILDELSVDILGAQGLALEIDKPAAHVKDEIFAKMGTPGWLLGLDVGGAGPTERQSEMVLQASRTRFALRRPYLTGLVATMLRMRGRTWKRGDWQLKQDLPNLQDMMKIAQANFLNAQAAMVSQRENGDNTPAPRGIDNNLRSPRARRTHKHGGGKSGDSGEPWAEPDPRLPRIERVNITRQLARWWALGRAAAAALGFNAEDRTFTPGPDMGDIFTPPEASIASLLALGERFTEENSGDDAPVLRAAWEAWVRGWINGAGDVDGDPDGYVDIEDAVRRQLIDRGGELVRDAVGRAYVDRVVNALASGQYDGMNPVNVAADLARRFEAGEYDWERLVASEMAIAQSRGKLDVYRAEGVALYDWTTAGSGVCPICTGHADRGPYPVDGANSPIPVVDSHPGCRCSLVAALDG